MSIHNQPAPCSLVRAPGHKAAFTLIELPAVRKGFTLIELMVVIMIMAILAGIVFGIMGFAARKAASARAMADIQQIKNALERYRLDYGGYPTVIGPMNSAGAAWDAMRSALTNYNQEVKFTDPWERPYQYESQGRYQFRLWSYGPDPNNIETRVENL